MATVQISDIYNPLVFSAGTDEAQIELNAFYASGVIQTSQQLNSMASVGGNYGEITGFAPLGQAEPNYSSDVSSNTSTPDNITKYVMKYRMANMNKSWSTMNLSRELALKDPVAAITSKIGGYWATQCERRVIQSTMGILADNVANDNSDMVHNIATDAAGAPTAAELISAEAIITTEATAGDHQGMFSAIAMHSVPFAELRKQQLIEYVS